MIAPQYTGSQQKPSLVLWCFVLNPHRRSPYPKSHFELRDKLRVSSPVRARGTNRVLLLPSPPFRFWRCSEAPSLFAFFLRLARGRGLDRDGRVAPPPPRLQRAVQGKPTRYNPPLLMWGPILGGNYRSAEPLHSSRSPVSTRKRTT